MKKYNEFQIMRKLLVLVSPLKIQMFFAIFFGIVGNLSASFITISGVYALLLIAQQTYSGIGSIFLFLGILGVSRAFFRYGEQSLNHYIAFKILALLRDKVFKVLRRLAPAKLDGKDKGNLIAMITSDIELLEVFYAHTISPVLIALFYGVLLCLYLSSFHWLISFIALLSFIIVGIFIPYFMNCISLDVGHRYRNSFGQLSTFIHDNLRGLFEVLQFNYGKKRLDQLNEYGNHLDEIESKMKKLSGLNIALTNLLIIIMSLIMLVCTIYLYKNQSIEFNEMIISVVVLMSSFGPFIALATLSSTLQNTLAAGNRILNLFEEEPMVLDVTGQENIEFSDIEIKNLSFGYNQEDILSNISMKISKNSIIGIMGKSGSGKSTLLKLLMRFYQRNHGEIQIAKRDIDLINTRNLRDMQSFVEQDTYLFNDTILNNIMIAKLNASKQEVIQASQEANIHDFIMSLPDGYDTHVGELGDALSTGEKQRIGLARAFLHDSNLLLLDEPTSNLDSLNEAMILNSIVLKKDKKTILLVSHQKSTLNIVDQCFCIEQGRVS